MSRFTLKQLGYFVAAGEAGSITLAAERVHISQPSISAAIAALEAEFGVQLFVRHHAQGLSLTAAGERLLIAARELMRAADDLGDLARDFAGGIAGPLRVGAFRTLSSLILPELVAGFAAANPRVDLTLVDGMAVGQGPRAALDIRLLDACGDGVVEGLASIVLGPACGETHESREARETAAAEMLSPENLDRAATAVYVATLAQFDLLRPPAHFARYA